MDAMTRIRNSADAAPVRVANSDQYFLLYFIIGNYFGPDLKEVHPKKPVLQRIKEGLQNYTLDQLAGSYLKTVEVERVYFYVLRKADRSLMVKLPVLRAFFQGKLSTPGNDPAAANLQFPQLFPTELHSQSRFQNRFKIIRNIAFISEPDPSTYMTTEDVERFKRLTGIENLVLDWNEAAVRKSLDNRSLYPLPEIPVQPNEQLPPIDQNFRSGNNSEIILHSRGLHSRDLRVHVVAPLQSFPALQGNGNHLLPTSDTEFMEKAGPAVIFLPSCAEKGDWIKTLSESVGGIVFTGVAALGKIGNTVANMDIGESDDEYIFRVSLQGVSRKEREFSCEIDRHGKVLIRGVTVTGEKTVYRFSRKFIMQSDNLDQPGPFSIEFRLPGPVDPRRFKATFSADGIFEGIVKKLKERQTSDENKWKERQTSDRKNRKRDQLVTSESKERQTSDE